MASTQVKHPWKTVVRTALQTLIGLAGAWALIVEAAGLDAGVEWVAASLAITAAITRVSALPAVDALLPRWLSADGSPSHHDISK